jgi:signal transduction histidine kinase
MRTVEALDEIRRPWLFKVSHRLARGEGVRESFIQQLERFFEMLTQAVETGNPGWLEPLLIEWVEARTQGDLEKRDTSLAPILDQILIATYQAARETLPESSALDLMGAVLPVYTHVFEFVSSKETALHIDHVSREIEEAKGSLERLDKSKSDFIAIAAHELKTPLTLIEGYMSMLRDQLNDHNGTSYALLLEGVDNGTRRLREIVDDMIDVSLIDNNLLALNFQPIWIRRMLAVLELEFSEHVLSRNQVFEVHPFPGSDEMTFGDEERLFQAFRNVITNAIKYTPDGGSIIIDGRKLPGFIEVTVADSGIGVDPDDHIRIFEKFGRLGSVSLHSSGKTKFKGGGPGLGLPITKGIIEAHGGAIWVESEGYDEVKCPGSVFHILLPMRKVPPDDKTAKLFRPLIEVANAEQVEF